MVAHYTVAKNRRDRDEYSEGGEMGKRPDRAVTVYSQNLKRLFPDVPVIIGGIEASLRRNAHYDYWADKVMPSILVPSKADLLIYGMGEKPWMEILALLKKNVPVNNIKDIRGTSYLIHNQKAQNLIKKVEEGSALCLPSFEEVSQDKKIYCKSFNIESKNLDPYSAKTLLQKHGEYYVVQNPPQYPLKTQEMDSVYDFPYERNYHPSYKKGVPALQEVKFSLTSARGCYGACSYCAITYHQSKHVQARSKESLVKEAKVLIADKDFKGYIHDVGGPSANIRGASCPKQEKFGSCKDKNCIGFTQCKNVVIDETEYFDILRTLRRLDGVKKVFVRSGIRYDILLADDERFMRELIKYHVSGQLKVAPEHNSDKVLKLMNKPPFETFLRFKKKYEKINEELGKKQYIIPYLISSHPGCTTKDAIRLAEYLKSIRYIPEQVQDFYPTPSTRSTCMYYTGYDPEDMTPVYVPKKKEEKAEQRALLQFNRPENYQLVKKALLENGRKDLIGNGPLCLIPDDRKNTERKKATPVIYVKKKGKKK